MSLVAIAVAMPGIIISPPPGSWPKSSIPDLTLSGFWAARVTAANPLLAAAPLTAASIPCSDEFSVLVNTATRFVVGAISRSNSIHLEPTAGSKLVAPVTFPPGLAKLWTMRLPMGSAAEKKTFDDGLRLLQGRHKFRPGH